MAQSDFTHADESANRSAPFPAPALPFSCYSPGTCRCPQCESSRRCREPQQSLWSGAVRKTTAPTASRSLPNLTPISARILPKRYDASSPLRMDASATTVVRPTKRWRWKSERHLKTGNRSGADLPQPDFATLKIRRFIDTAGCRPTSMRVLAVSAKRPILKPLP